MPSEAEEDIQELEDQIVGKILSEICWAAKKPSVFDLREKVLPEYHIDDAEPIIYEAILTLMTRGIPILGFDDFERGQSVAEVERYLDRRSYRDKIRTHLRKTLERCLRRMRERPCTQCKKAAAFRDYGICYLCYKKLPGSQQET